MASQPTVPSDKERKLQEEIDRLQSQLKSLQSTTRRDEDDSAALSAEISGNGLSSNLGSKSKSKSLSTSTSNQILIVVANRLPVSMQYVDAESGWKFKPSAGGLVTALKQLDNLDMEWVGCPGYIEPSEREYISRKLGEFHVHPVYVERRDYDHYYNGFCNMVLWPLFHYIELADSLVVPQYGKYYGAYSRINLLFAKAIDALMVRLKKEHGPNKDIVVWLHDYHLMLCPLYVRRLQRECKMGWFLHIPFPSWEQFRILPKAGALLQGVLSCNLIGFHIHDYAQHFRGAAAHILQCEVRPQSVVYRGRMSMVSTHPIGTDVERWSEGLRSQEVERLIARWKRVHRGKAIILGVDRMDFIKGIPHKLYAFDRFLRDNEELREKIVYIQIAVPSRQNAPEYQKLTAKCNELVGSINAKYSSFSSVPLHFLFQSFGFSELVALYSIASVCYVTSLRDGMNLVSYEYVACQKEEDPGVLVLSEFAGSAQSLGAGSIVVNPWDVEQVANALKRALSMDLEQRKQHQSILKRIISTNTVQRWANSFVSSLHNAALLCPPSAPIVPSPINPFSLQRSFMNPIHKKKLIVLGLGGTLIPTFNSIKTPTVSLLQYAAMNKIPKKTVEAINALSKAQDVTIAILSSLPRKAMEVLLEGVRCIQYAENGYFVRDNTESSVLSPSSDPKKWRISTNYTDNSWKDEVLQIMTYFKERTPGTALDDLTSFVSFRYGLNAKQHQDAGDGVKNESYDPNQGLSAQRNNISQCVTSLQTGPLQSSYARLVHDTASGHIQVRQPGVSKLASITRLIQRMQPIDYILCIANFLSFDEEVFVFLNGLQHPPKSGNDEISQIKEEVQDLKVETKAANGGGSGGVNNVEAKEEEIGTATNATVSSSGSGSGMKRISSSGGLAKMYPSTDTDQFKYDSKMTGSGDLTLMGARSVVDTVKVDRFATRAMHYVTADKVQDILVRLSQTIGSSHDLSTKSNADDSMSSLMESHRNWSVDENLSRFKDESDSDRERQLHQNVMRTGSPGLNAGGMDIPPTFKGDGYSDRDSSDYGSFDEDDAPKQEDKAKELRAGKGIKSNE